MSFQFTLKTVDPNSGARLGQFQTLHGVVETPVFMPVGTMATVKTLNSDELLEVGSQIILGNTYHLLLRPGLEVFKRFGGIHNFMKWDRPLLTDSGGFQIFSLPKSRKITEEGAVFQSYIEGSEHKLSPESSIAMQNAIGSDIMMVLDQCIESTADYSKTKEAMQLTHRWAKRSLVAHTDRHSQALFGIVQGGVFEDLRNISAQVLTQMDFDGFAIGGLAVGETKNQREDYTELVARLLPQNKPRYLMGVGTPADLLEAVRRGVDMFDCIIPTKMAQQGKVYTSRGEVNLSHGQFKLSDEKVDNDCGCSTCRIYSRGYLHHLTKCREALGWRALAVHNLHYYHRLMTDVRASIAKGRFMDFYKACLRAWESGEEGLESELGREPPIFEVPKKRNRGAFIEL
jgi:queuine tRNA-ribosyltransferase